MQKFAEHAAPALPTTADSATAADKINAHNTVTATAVLGIMKWAATTLDGMLRQLPQELSCVLAPKPTAKPHGAENSGIHVVETQTVIATPQLSNTAPSASPASVQPSRFHAQRYPDGSMSLFETSGGRTTRKPIVLAIRTPSKPQLVHIHPSPEFRSIDLHTVQDQVTNVVYAVSDKLARDLAIEGRIKVANLCVALTMTKCGVAFLWPVDLRRGCSLTSGLAAIHMASEHSIEVRRDENGPTPWQSAGYWGGWSWAAITIPEVIEAAFNRRFISSVNDPVLWRIRNYRTSH